MLNGSRNFPASYVGKYFSQTCYYIIKRQSKILGLLQCKWMLLSHWHRQSFVLFVSDVRAGVSSIKSKTPGCDPTSQGVMMF